MSRCTVIVSLKERGREKSRSVECGAHAHPCLFFTATQHATRLKALFLNEKMLLFPLPMAAHLCVSTGAASRTYPDVLSRGQ
jgi:hypothetical protein